MHTLHKLYLFIDLSLRFFLDFGKVMRNAQWGLFESGVMSRYCNSGKKEESREEDVENYV